MITVKESQAIGKILSDFKYIQEIDITNAGLDQNKAKEIADGIMRAKQLQIFKAGRNSSMSANGAYALLYNLAFSPKISHIDFTGVPL